MPTTDLTTQPYIAVLTDLERDGALSPFQAERLLAAWPTLKDDWASSPFFRTAREHSRAYIDQLRQAPKPATDEHPKHQPDPNPNHPRKEIHHV